MVEERGGAPGPERERDGNGKGRRGELWLGGSISLGHICDIEQ